jgi:hypothetical protein
MMSVIGHFFLMFLCSMFRVRLAIYSEMSLPTFLGSRVVFRKTLDWGGKGGAMIEGVPPPKLGYYYASHPR